MKNWELLHCRSGSSLKMASLICFPHCAFILRLTTEEASSSSLWEQCDFMTCLANRMWQSGFQVLVGLVYKEPFIQPLWETLMPHGIRNHCLHVREPFWTFKWLKAYHLFTEITLGIQSNKYRYEHSHSTDPWEGITHWLYAPKC